MDRGKRVGRVYGMLSYKLQRQLVFTSFLGFKFNNVFKKYRFKLYLEKRWSLKRKWWDKVVTGRVVLILGSNGEDITLARCLVLQR